MELINDFNHLDNKYSKKINIIKYTEGENVIIEVEGVKDISELIIGSWEVMICRGIPFLETAFMNNS